MSLVDPNRTVTPASLVRTPEEGSRYPGLERVGQKLARGLAEFLTGLMSTPSAVSVLPLRMEESPAGAVLVARQLVLDPTSATVELAVGRGTLMSLVDLYYGGEGKQNEDLEQLSPAESRFFTRIAEAFAKLLGTCWIPQDSIKGRVDPDSVAEFAGSALQTFSIAFPDGASCELFCRYPLTTLEAFPELESAQGDQIVVDHNWQAHLMGRALDVTLPVRAVFAEPEVALARLLDLRPGDIIPVRPPTTIDLTVAGLPFARGSAGESNGRAAICIDHL